MQVPHILRQRKYKAGDPAPEGYLPWHEWARAQYNAGVRQSRCAKCKRWWFPQEWNAHGCKE